VEVRADPSPGTMNSLEFDVEFREREESMRDSMSMSSGMSEVVGCWYLRHCIVAC
jgi:hypothetical protein